MLMGYYQTESYPQIQDNKLRVKILKVQSFKMNNYQTLRKFKNSFIIN